MSVKSIHIKRFGSDVGFIRSTIVPRVGERINYEGVKYIVTKIEHNWGKWGQTYMTESDVIVHVETE